MPIQISEENNGKKTLVVQVSGTLATEDHKHFALEFERRVGRPGKPRVLFDMVDFHGWEPGAAWEDIKFDLKHYADIERLAMVGDARWQHGLELLFKPFTKATIRYFDHADIEEARQWLDEG